MSSGKTSQFATVTCPYCQKAFSIEVLLRGMCWTLEAQEELKKKLTSVEERPVEFGVHELAEKKSGE